MVSTRAMPRLEWPDFLGCKTNNNLQLFGLSALRSGNRLFMEERKMGKGRRAKSYEHPVASLQLRVGKCLAFAGKALALFGLCRLAWGF